MTQPPFRKVALERLASPERLDGLMEVVSLKAWVALLACALAIVAAVVWAVLGSLSDQVVGQGILAREGGYYTVEVPVSGTVARILVRPDDTLAKGQVVALVERDGQENPVRSPFAGRVVELERDPGESIKEGQAILKLEMASRPYVCYILVQGRGSRLKPGMEVHLEPAGIPMEEYGLMLGRVRDVSNSPVSVERIDAIVENRQLATQLGGSGSAYLVEVLPEYDPATPSGFHWTTRKGPPEPFGTGTLMQAQFLLRKQAPITLVMPALKKWFRRG